MALLDELASQGHVIILITHDHKVAARAQRVIEIRDGRMISDSATDQAPCPARQALQADDLRQRLDRGATLRGAWKASCSKPCKPPGG